MKVRDIFTIGGPDQSFNGRSEFLDQINCEIVGKTQREHAVLLQLKRQSDGEEGHAYLKVQDQFKDGTQKLLNWAFNSKEMIGLNLNQLRDLDVNLEIELSQGRLSIK
jgi:hypothetical protein